MAADIRVTKFLGRIGFNEKDFEKKSIKVGAEKLVQVFFYEGSEKANTSFYFITQILTTEEKYFIDKYIWSKNDAEIYFFPQQKEVVLFATGEPRDSEDRKVDSFKYEGEDQARLEKIEKKEFDRGTFWLNFDNLLRKVKGKDNTINKKLISTLKRLKDNLLSEYRDNLPNIQNSSELVQALIDRTLFIKFLEDKRIISSSFYKIVFKDETLHYKELLEQNRIDDINTLYEKINLIFSNSLFKIPAITKEKWSENICTLLKNAISQQDEDGQLSLFDFDFSVIPIEFIGHIYEVFEDKQDEKGVYYTPKTLASLIVDEVLGSEIGTVLDPACGSGMFLITAFRKILANNGITSYENKDIEAVMRVRNSLLKSCIFGIEKEHDARRLALFSLYLEMLNGIDYTKLEEHIVTRLGRGDDPKVFLFDFEDNILHANSLEIDKNLAPYQNKKFDFIVGNPPFFEIKSTHEKEAVFLDKYDLQINDKKFLAKDIIGKAQISQCFMLKIKEWAKERSRFGFVLNYSNFTNEKSLSFRKFFFGEYKIETFYELSEIKDILFIKAKENICTIVFDNQFSLENVIKYLKIESNQFSKVFKIPVLQEDNIKTIGQQDILEGKVTLRDYLFANEYDLELIEGIKAKSKDMSYHLSDYKNFNGMDVVGIEAIIKSGWMKEEQFKALDKLEQQKLFQEFKQQYFTDEETDIPFIKPKNIDSYTLYPNEYIIRKKNIEDETEMLKKFKRGREPHIYEGNKILLSRIDKRIKAVFSKEKVYFNFDIYTIRLKEDLLNNNKLLVYDTFVAILNSNLVNYYLQIKELRRSKNSFPKYNTESIKKIPIPKNLDEDLLEEIAQLSKEFSEGSKKYEGKAKKRMNHLIGDLYDLNILDKIRIEEFLYKEKKRKLSVQELEQKYCNAIKETLFLYYPNLKTEVFEGRNLPFNLVCVALYLDENQPTSKRYLEEVIDEVIEKANIDSFLPINRIYVTKKAIYIIKENQFKNWTETKAFEDGQEILTKYVQIETKI